jgi:hypothetical protein
MSPDSQALFLIGLARYMFMLELESVMKENKRRMGISTREKEKWPISNKCDMEMALRSSPSASAIDNWVVHLALEQALIASAFFKKCGAVHLMSDGGHKGSQVKLLSWDENNKSLTALHGRRWAQQSKCNAVEACCMGHVRQVQGTFCVGHMEAGTFENVEDIRGRRRGGGKSKMEQVTGYVVQCKNIFKSALLN